MNSDNKDKIQQLLNSEALNYLETYERLILKNMLGKENISDMETEILDRVFIKYEKFLKN